MFSMKAVGEPLFSTSVCFKKLCLAVVAAITRQAVLSPLWVQGLLTRRGLSESGLGTLLLMGGLVLWGMAGRGGRALLQEVAVYEMLHLTCQLRH